MNETTGQDENGGRRFSWSILVMLMFVCALLATATAGSAATESPAEPEASEVSALASGPREVRYLCASKKSNILRYVTGPKQCTGKQSRITISSDRPITACASESSGIVRRIPLSGKCRSGEDRMTLPGKEPQRFCAAAALGRLIYDPNSPCEPEDIPVVVPAANKAPSARADAVTVDEDGSVDLTLRATDPDGDRLTYSIENDPDHGEVTGSDADRTYTPDPDFNGNDAFAFRVSDGKGGTDTARVSVSVAPVNDAPVAEDDSKFTPENTPLVFPASDLLSNDSKGAPNENAQNLTVRSVSNALHGLVDLTGGQITFTPETDYKGPASFEYEVCDDGTPQLCSTQTATVSVAVTPVNTKPVATDGTESMDEDDPPITIDLGALVSDAETADADLTYTITDGPSASEGELTGSGSTRTFDSADDFNGTVEILYKVTDRGDPDDCGAPGPDCAETKDSDVAKVTVTVDSVNDAPQSSADSYGVDEDGTLNVADGAGDLLSNDADAEDDPLTAVPVSNPSHAASFTLNPNGSFDYTPEADYFGADSFTYKANDGTADGNTVTVTIDVRPVNDAPAAADDSTSTDEDTEKVLDPRTNDSSGPANENGQSLEVAAITDDAQHGTATVIDGGSNVSYEPNADYSGPDTFSYEVCDDGKTGAPPADDPKCDTAAVDVTVATVNDAPDVTASTGSVSYTEGQTGPDATVVDDGLTVSDVDNANLSSATVEITANFASGDQLAFSDTAAISGAYNSGTGVLTLTGNASVADYQAALRTVTFRSNVDDPGSATRTVRFTVDDGEAANNTDSDTRDVTVTPVNDAPTNTLPSGPLTVAQDKDVSITGISVADPDARGGEFEVTFGAEHGDITLDNGVNGGLVSGDMTGNGTGTVTATATLAKLNATLGDPDGLVYHSDASFTGLDTLTVTTDDRGNTGTGGNQTDTDTLSLDVKKINDAPIPTDDDRTVAEDGTLTFLASTLAANDSPGANEAGQTLTVTAVNSTADTHGTVSLDDKANADPADDEVRYVPDTNYNGSAIFDYTVQDDGGTANGGQDTATGTVNVTITAVNDAPVATDDSRTTDEDTDLVVAASDLATNDDKGPVSATDETSQNLTVTAVGNASGGAATLSNGQITFDPNNDFNGLASFEYTVRDDGQTDGSDDFKTDTGTVHVTVTAVNDAPVNSVPGSQTVDEDTALTFSPSLSTSDIDASSNDVRLTLNVDHGTLTLATMTGLSFSTGDGTDDAVIDVTGTISEVNAALDGLTYKGNSNYSGSDTLTITTNDLGNTGSGGAKSDTDTVGITVNPVNDAPVADDETFNGASSAIGNTSLIVNDPDDGAPNQSGPKKTITGDILAGDTDVDGPGPLTVTPGTFATNDGGSVTIQDDGDFTFHPAASTNCTDTSDFFDYSLEDSGDPEQTDTGRVTISIAGCVWYVSNNAAGNSGTSQAPFDTLAQAETASDANHTVFVYDGDNTTTGYDADGYQMNAGERLIGEHEGLTVDPDQGGALTAEALHPANVGAHPTFTATNADVIDLDDGNELRGFNVDPVGTGGGIFGGSGDTGGGTIDDVNIIDNGTAAQQAGLELNGTTGTFNVTDFVVANKAHGVLLNNAGTVDFGGDSSQVSLSTSGGPAITATATSMGTSQIDDITVTNSTNGAVDMDTTTGATVLGDDTGTDLNLTTASGAEPALDLNSAGTLAVGSGGTDELHATGGPALDVTSTGGPSLDFDDVDSTNSSTDGVNLDGLGTGTFSASSGDITGASGIAFDLNGGSGAITYPGNLNNGSGSTAEITGRSGGAVTLSGQITDNNDLGGGINLASNTDGSTTFSNATKTLNTVSGDALLFNGSDGHTLTLSGGGLDIDTTSGRGLEAATSGTIVVTGTGNTIDTGTGRALNISNTDIGADDAVFQGISSNGAVNGIVLDTTGTAGNLIVSGTGSTTKGGNASGGTIQNTTGHGVSLINTTNPSFNNVTLQNTRENGVNGSQVTGFSFTNGTVSGAGDASDESSFSFDESTTNANVSGAVTITNNNISDTEADGVDIENHTGTISHANISDNSLDDTGDVATPGSAVRIVALGSGSTVANVTRATLANNVISDFRAGAGFVLQGGNSSDVGGAPSGTYGVPGSVTNVIAVTGNRMDGGNGGVGNQPDRFVTGAVNGRGQGNFDVSNNGTGASPITRIDGVVIELSAFGATQVTANVTNNLIVANNAVASSGIGIGCDADSQASTTDNATLTTTISNNTVSQTDGPGIYSLARNSSCSHTTRILNNNVSAPSTSSSARAGIRVDSGSSVGDTTLCLEMSGNTTAGSANIGTGSVSPGINLRKQGTDTNINTFGIEGLTPSPAGTPTVENHVNSQNTSVSGTFGVAGTALLSATSGFTSCNAP